MLKERKGKRYMYRERRREREKEREEERALTATMRGVNTTQHSFHHRQGLKPIISSMLARNLSAPATYARQEASRSKVLCWKTSTCTHWKQILEFGF